MLQYEDYGHGAPHSGSLRARDELLELAYRHALQHGVANLSLRPLAAAVGSSPRVLLYLFGSKDDLVRALLARARQDEFALLASASHMTAGTGLARAGARLWQWLADPDHHDLIRLRIEAYARAGLTVEQALRAVSELPSTDKLVVCHGDACLPNALLSDEGKPAGHVDLGLGAVVEHLLHRIGRDGAGGRKIRSLDVDQ